MKVIILITNVLSVQMDVRHQKEPQYAVLVVLEELLKISFVSIVKLAKYLKLEIQPVKVALLVFINLIRVKEYVEPAKLVLGVIQLVVHRF